MRVRHGCTAIFPPSALFPGISRRCTWRVGATSVHPRSARAPSFGVRLRIHPHKRAHCPVRNTFTRALRTASAASAQPRLTPGAPAPKCACRRRRSGCPTSEARSFRGAKVARGRADAPRPPALFVVYPVSFIYGASLDACAYRMEQLNIFRLCFAQTVYAVKTP